MRFFNFSKYVEDVCFEYGTENLKYSIPSKNLYFSDQNIILINNKSEKLKAVGQSVFNTASSLKNTSIVSPVKNGSISDYKASVEVFSYYLDKIAKNLKFKSRFLGPNIYISLHTTTTEVEISALSDSINNFNISTLAFINEGIAAKLGVDSSIENNTVIVCNLGAGVTDIHLLINNEVYLDESFIYGGNDLDNILIDYIKTKYNVLISIDNAKLLKSKISLNYKLKESISISGKDMFNNLPKNLTIELKEFSVIIEDYLKIIINKIITIMEQIDSKVIDNLLNGGIFLSGGLSKISGIKEFFSKQTKLKVTLAEDNYSVLKGLAIIMGNRNLLEKSKIKDLILL
jgi:rod shape-determining protein MreB